MADPSGLRLSFASKPFDLGRLLAELRPVDPEELRVRVRRPDDLLVFDLLFDNLRIAEAGPPGEGDEGDGGEAPPARLVRKTPGAPATLIVELPPQSFGEEAFVEVAEELEDEVGSEGTGQEVFDENDPDYQGFPKKNAETPAAEEPPGSLPAARVRMAGRSRLAFVMPADADGLDFTLAGVLAAMRTWPLRLDVSAQPDPPRRLTVAEALGEAPLVARWAGVRHDLVAALEARGAGQAKGAGDLGEAVARAGARVGERTLAGLAGLGGSAAECLAPALQAHLFEEVDRLAASRRALRRGEERDAAVAAVALAAVETLAERAPRLAVAGDVAAALPVLPLLLSPHLPPRTVTALELPYRLLLSPIESARFTHRDLPFTRRGRTELWHTRMTTGADDLGPDAPGKARAIWSPDYPIPVADVLDLLTPEPLPFRMSLDPLDRQMLVRLMAGYDEVDPWQNRYRPTASRVERLHLSALGGLLDLEGNWEERPDGVDLEQWRHRASLGRDAYVRVVYAGYLCPCQHACSLVKVTERKFERLGDGPGRVAVLRQRFFLVPRERVKVYDPSEHEFRGHNFPFPRVELLTRVTPDLLVPGEGDSVLEAAPGAGNEIYGEFDGKPIAKRMVFWPMLPHPTEAGAGVDFRFDLAATDLTGRRVTFSVPLLFVGEIANDVRDDAIRAAYDASDVSHRRGDLGGATVAYAPLAPSAEGDPRLPTAGLTLGAGALRQGLHHEREPNFYPEVAEAEVGIRPLQKLLGKADAVVPVAYPEVYKLHGFGESDPTQNQGELFLQLVGSPFPLEFGGDPDKAKSDALGSLASPQMQIRGLSRVMGPVAANPPADPNVDPLAKVIGGEFNPASFFSGAKILGGIDLAEILTVVSALTGADVPKMVSRELPDRIEAKFTWDTEITNSDLLGLFIPGADPDKSPTRLLMKGMTTTPLGAPQDASFLADAELDNFKVNLFGFVVIWFERLAFRAAKGQKPDVAVELRQGSDAVVFGGPLEFVNTLRELIPSGGFSDPPAIEVTPSGIGASYFLNLPTVGVGVLSISNLSLGAGFRLPFDATPASVQFGFSRRESPFSLTVSFLGGGGFFALGISTRGVNEIEAALEFGAGAAIDLGVASGSVEIKAGVYFHWLEPVPDAGSVELSGYVRLHGELSVLGIISASLTFNLQLSYLKEGSRSVVWGEATLTIEVEVLFFSASVEVRCRREFGGSESDPKFIDQIPTPAVWTEYCEAFALEEAA